MATVIVRNVLTGKESIYVNDSSLAENIVNEKIIQAKQTGQILDKDVRSKHASSIKTSVSKITGNLFAFCEDTDLIAKFSK